MDIGIDLRNSVVGQALGIPQKEKWAIVDAESGKSMLNFSAFLQMEVIDDGSVVSVPVEEGSFAVYNKTDHPREVKVQLAKQGSEGELQGFLADLEAMRLGLDIVDIYTPTSMQFNLNLEKYDFVLSREAGRGVIYSELTFLEVRQVEAQYTDEKLAPVQDRGKVQTKPAEIAKKEPAAKPGTGYRKPQDPNRSGLRIIMSKAGIGKFTGFGK